METKIYMKTVKGGACFGAGFEGLGFCSHLLVSQFPEFLQQKAVKFCFCYIRLQCRGISMPFSCHISSWIFVLQQLAPISLTWRAVLCCAEPLNSWWIASGLQAGFGVLWRFVPLSLPPPCRRQSANMGGRQKGPAGDSAWNLGQILLPWLGRGKESGMCC